MKTLILAAASAFLSAVAGAAEAPAQAKVGDSIPAVTLKSVDGEDVKLQELVKSQPAVLIFYRGGWCPYCAKHLMALAEIEDELKAAGFQIIAISADQSAKISETPNREKLNYTLLSDSTMAGAKAFGITFHVPDEVVAKYKADYKIDLEAASGETHHTLPHPAVFIVDQQGIIRFAHVNPDYKTRLQPEKILAAARSITR